MRNSVQIERQGNTESERDSDIKRRETGRRENGRAADRKRYTVKQNTRLPISFPHGQCVYKFIYKYISFDLFISIFIHLQ